MGFDEQDKMHIPISVLPLSLVVVAPLRQNTSRESRDER